MAFENQTKSTYLDEKELDVSFPDNEKKRLRNKIKGIIIYTIIFVFSFLFFIFLFGSLLHLKILILPKWTGEIKISHSEYPIHQHMEKSVVRMIGKMFRNVEGNHVWSPFITSLALSLLLEGSRERTAWDITSAMNWNSLHISEIRSHFNDVLSHIKESTNGIKIANRMFIQDKVNINDFYEYVLEKYDADIARVDFHSVNATLTKINQWGIEKSEGLIKELITPELLNSDVIGIISSLMTFRGRWKVPFNKKLTNQAKFTQENGKDVNVTMMYNSGHFKYGYLQEYQLHAIELPYDIPDTVMMILLPSNLQQLKELLFKNDSSDILLGLRSRMKNSNIEICLPKFEVQTNLFLEEELQSMGIKDLFNIEKSNLKGISSDEDFYVQKIVQGIKIKVNEEITEGSSYSSSIIGSRSLSMTICADRPFIFYVQEKTYGSVLFWGEYKSPHVNNS